MRTIDVFMKYFFLNLDTLWTHFLYFAGSYDVGAQGKLRIFFSQPRCRKSLNLVKGKTYLIMGASRDIYRDKQEQS